MFWNVAGVRAKDKDFWARMKEWDVIVLMETWMEEKGWEVVKRRVPEGFVWKMQAAKRVNKKSRWMGGMLLGIRKELCSDDGEGQESEELEGSIEVKLVMNGRK